MLYLQLFISFFKIGLFGIGGGLAILSLIQMEVEAHGWMTQQEFVDIVAVSQVTPGPFGINCATYVGYTTAGIWGSVLATTAIVLPSLIIMLTICKAYFWLRNKFQGNPYYEQTLRMLRFTVVALLTVLPNFISQKSKVESQKVPTGTPIKRMTEVLSHPILLIILAGIAGYCIYR